LQEKARAARYDLLLAYARTIKADAIAFAHHKDDQAETVLMRLASGSGLSGLAGMKPTSHRDGHFILRPFLNVPSARLRATLDARGIVYVDDPSNSNVMFARVRLRQSYAILEAEGLSVERLKTLSDRMARADDALRLMTEKAALQYVIPFETGRIYSPALLDEPSEIILRVLQGAIAEVGTGADPVLNRLESRILDLCCARSSGKPLKLTLGGAILSLSADGRLKILPEPPRRKV
jgi:tRNA(Ile)-lysidine synthase